MKSTMLFALMAVAAFAGCNDGPTANYTGSVNVRKVNGQIANVEVTFPSATLVRNRVNATALVDQIESLLVDLKSARDQFQVDESTYQQEVIR